jgi:hypothetical protein
LPIDQPLHSYPLLDAVLHQVSCAMRIQIIDGSEYWTSSLAKSAIDVYKQGNQNLALKGITNGSFGVANKMKWLPNNFLAAAVYAWDHTKLQLAWICAQVLEIDVSSDRIEAEGAAAADLLR